MKQASNASALINEDIHYLQRRTNSRGYFYLVPIAQIAVADVSTSLQSFRKIRTRNDNHWIVDFCEITVRYLFFSYISCSVRQRGCLGPFFRLPALNCGKQTGTNQLGP